ncbi:MAG: lipase family protein [Maricaulaceae bacterium]
MKFLPSLLALTFALTAASCGSENETATDVPKVEIPQVAQAATGPLSRIVRGDGGVSDFYKYKETLPAKTGVLLRQEPLTAKQSVPGAAQNIRLLYSSIDGIDGSTPIPVSGSLFLPEGTAPEGGWPLIAWTHGTVGIADICAPSWTGYVPFHQEYLKQWLDQGYAIVASDYQGLGTAGTHPYLATQPASYNNLDIIRAVQSADFPVSDEVVLIGQSQGAAAAFATAGHAGNYAPELDIKGVAVTGIPYFTPRTIEIIQETRPNDVVDPMLGYNFLALTLIEQMEAEFKVSDYVSDEALSTANAVDTTCHRDVKTLVTEGELTYNKSFKQDPSEPLKTAFAQMGYPRLDISVPAYIGTGVIDRDTPLRMQANLVKQSCAAGAVIQSNIYSGKDHLTVLNHSTVDSIPFVKAAFAGEAITGNCGDLPF